MRPVSTRLRRLGPGLALDWACPAPRPRPPRPWAALARPQELGFSSAGVGGAPQRKAGLRPRPRRGSFGGTKRVAEGAVAPMAGPAAHSQCMQVLPPVRGGRRKQGQSP